MLLYPDTKKAWYESQGKDGPRIPAFGMELEEKTQN